MGSDFVDFGGDIGVTVDLALTTAQKSAGEAGGDVISNCERVRGTEHDDVLEGTTGNDRLAGNAGDDRLEGRDGDDTLFGSTGEDILQGGAGDDTMNGEGGIDKLNGGGGNDTLSGGAELDTFFFDNFGNDTISDFTLGATVADSDKIVVCIKHADGRLPDLLLEQISTDVEFIIRIGSGPRRGSVVLTGVANSGSNRAKISALTQILDPDSAGCQVTTPLTAPSGFEAVPGNGQVTLSWDDPANANLSHAFQQREQGGTWPAAWTDIDSPSAVGAKLEHTVAGLTSGTTYEFRVRAARGSNAGSPTDEVSVIPGIYGTPQDDTLTGDDMVDYIAGLAGDDTLSGLGGNDILEGGAGADALDGGAGNDTASYASSNTGVTVRLFDNSASGGHAQGDTLTSIENLVGSAHNDQLEGDSGVNKLKGGRGGQDLINGWGGNDAFFFEAGFGDDTLVGYALGATVSASEALNLCMGTASNQPTFTTADSGLDMVITVMLDGVQQGTITLTLTANNPNKANVNVVVHAARSASCSF